MTEAQALSAHDRADVEQARLRADYVRTHHEAFWNGRYWEQYVHLASQGSSHTSADLAARDWADTRTAQVYR